MPKRPRLLVERKLAPLGRPARSRKELEGPQEVGVWGHRFQLRAHRRGFPERWREASITQVLGQRLGSVEVTQAEGDLGVRLQAWLSVTLWPVSY